MNLDISVILPVFWRQATPGAVKELQRAIGSVLEQRYPGQLEILVIDDGSPSPVAAGFPPTALRSDPRIRWLRLRHNEGLVNALNVGLASARYDLIARIDSDDAWLPGKVEKQAELLARDPDLTIVGAGMRLKHQSGAPDVNLVRPGDWRGILDFFGTVGCPFPHGSVIARRSVYLLLGGYPHDPLLSHCEDFALWGTWIRFFRPAMVEQVLYDYTVSTTSVSGVHALQQRRASGLVHQTFLDLGDTSRIPEAVASLGTVLGVSPHEAGRLAFLIWKYRTAALLPESAVPHLRTLLPDRRIATHLNPDRATSRRLQMPAPRPGAGKSVCIEVL